MHRVGDAAGLKALFAVLFHLADVEMCHLNRKGKSGFKSKLVLRKADWGLYYIRE